MSQQQYGYHPPPPHYGGYAPAPYGQPAPAPYGYQQQQQPQGHGYRPPQPHSHQHPHHMPQPLIHPPPPVAINPSNAPSAAANSAAAAPAASTSAPASTPVVPYIGARISLISVMGVRYEGTLYTIDTKASTVALQHVTCFGTEDRPSDNGYMPPSTDVYEFIIFGGKDIKDLSVLQQKAPAPAPHDPAIISTQQPPQPAAAAPAPAHHEEPEQELEETTPSQPHQQQPRQHQQRNQRGGRQQHRDNNNKQHTVRVLDENRRGGHHHAPAHTQTTAENQAPFDFQSSNARFEKVTEATAGSSSATAAASVPSYDLPSADNAQLDTSGFPSVTKKYDKSKSFFDDLTLDKTGRQDPNERREMRRVDADTFGSDAAHYRSKHTHRGGGGHHRGGGRGRGRGGRGGGQGQWRQAEH